MRTRKKGFALATVGNVNVDLILGPVDPCLHSGTESIVDHNELRVGGSAGNAALAWAALGCEHQIAANTGKDQFGDWLRARFGTQASKWPKACSGTTLSVGITHPDGERTFLTTKGHLNDLSWPDVRAMIDWKTLEGGVLLVCGGFLTPKLVDDYQAMFDHAHSHNIRVALDTGWPLTGWTDATRHKALGWVAGSDCLLFNEVEATSLSQQDNVELAGRWLLDRMQPDAAILIKQGAEGASLFRQDGLCSCSAPKVDVVDTIGAGDVCNAAFLAALSEGQSWQSALQIAVETASIAISTNPRAYHSEPKRETNDEFS